MLRILSLLSVLTLAGCATGMYNEPDAGDAAKLSVEIGRASCRERV